MWDTMAEESKSTRPLETQVLWQRQELERETSALKVTYPAFKDEDGRDLRPKMS